MSTPNRTKAQVSTDVNFTDIVYEYDGEYSVELPIEADAVPVDTILYARALHGHPDTGDSDWSDITQFTVFHLWASYDTTNDSIPTDLTGASVEEFKVIQLTSGKYLLVRCSPGGYTYGSILTISGSTVTFVTTVTVDAHINERFSLFQLSNTAVGMVTRYTTSLYMSYQYMTLDADHTTITPGTRTTLQAASTDFFTAISMSAYGDETTKLAIAWMRSSTYYLTGMILVVDSSTGAITQTGTIQTLMSLQIQQLDVMFKANSTAFYLGTKSRSTNQFMMLYILVADTVMTVLNTSTVTEVTIYYHFDFVLLDDTRLLLIYTDNNNGYYMTAAILQYATDGTKLITKTPISSYYSLFPKVESVGSGYFLTAYRIYTNASTPLYSEVSVLRVNLDDNTITVKQQHQLVDIPLWWHTFLPQDEESVYFMGRSEDMLLYGFLMRV